MVERARVADAYIQCDPAKSYSSVKRSEGDAADVEEMRSVLNALQGM